MSDRDAAITVMASALGAAAILVSPLALVAVWAAAFIYTRRKGG